MAAIDMKFNEKLEKILLNAYKNVPYYNKLFYDKKIDINKINSYESFQKIPLLDKKIIRSNPMHFINNQIDFNKLHCSYTSGSTGVMLPVYWSKNDRIKSEIHLLRERERIGYNNKDLSCLFAVKYSAPGVHETYENIKYNSLKNRIYFDASKLNDENCYIYFKIISSYSPKVIMGTPSVLYVFATYIIENNFMCNFDVEYIELYGEFLSETCRRKIKKCFKNAKLVNQYGCRETGAIAIEHDENRMYCIAENVYVEVLKDGIPVDDGEDGELFITTLTNFAMPVIRYRTGDIGCLNEEKNKCGDLTKRLTIRSGRECDHIILKDKSNISGAVFWLTVDSINEQTDAILQFNVVQVDYNKFVVNLVLDDNVENVTIENLFKEYLSIYINCEIELIFVFHKTLIPNKESGKLKYFIRKFANN